ncbi:MAG TPA: ParB/RepB/Spo0J family partition protein [Aestuariivirgaceae bacterium]|jgi:ParB family chromosome partitioning protein
MMPQQTKRRLGRGLAALIGEEASEDSAAVDPRLMRQIPIEFLHANPNNPRKAFKDDELEDLSRSIRERGLLQPIVARTRADGRSFEIVAGERRWRAAQRAGIHEVPVIVRELSDGEALEVALIENIQRADLNALEEARAYSQLMDQFHYTQQQLADSLGKSRSHIANTHRLLTLPTEVKKLIEDGLLTAGHARSLIAVENPAQLAAEIIKRGLSVRDAEKLSRVNSETRTGRRRVATSRGDPNIQAIERSLTEATGVKIEVIDAGLKGGRLVAHYRTLEQLDDLCQRLRRRQ